jgi:hypothetical protein
VPAAAELVGQPALGSSLGLLLTPHLLKQTQVMLLQIGLLVQGRQPGASRQFLA